MVPITEVAKGIFKVGPLDTRNPLTPATSPFLVVGERAAIVEPGESGQAPELLDGIREIGVDLNRIDYLMPTHIHLHHIHGANVLLREIPQAKVVAHQRGVPHLKEPTQLNEEVRLEAWGEKLFPVPEDRIIGCSGGEVIDLGGRELEIVDARGHAPHHLAIFDRLTRALFPGDAVGVLGLGHERGRPEIVPPLFDIEKHVDSLRRLRALKPSVLFTFGYGGVSHSPDKTLQWAEEDVRAIESICREGMKQGMSLDEIGGRVLEYHKSVGLRAPTEGQERRREIVTGLIGMMNYIKRQDPSREIPK